MLLPSRLVSGGTKQSNCCHGLQRRMPQMSFLDAKNINICSSYNSAQSYILMYFTLLGDINNDIPSL